MNWSKLQNKIFLLVTALFSIVLVLTLISIYNAAKNQAEQQLFSSLEVGKKVISEKLELTQYHLENNLNTLAKDWALRKAIGERHDTESIVVLLNNHGERVGADLIWLFDAEKKLMAQTGLEGNAILTRDYMRVLRSDSAIKVMTVNDRHYMMALQPVRAPRLIGWILVGHEIGQDMMLQLSDLTARHVGIVSTNADTNEVISAISFGEYAHLAKPLFLESAAPENVQILNLDTLQMAVLPFKISGNYLNNHYIVLHENADAVLEPLNDFLYQVIPYFIGGIILAILGSLLIARGITKPVAELLTLVRDVASGNYEREIVVCDSGELGELATEFGNMQTAVQERENKIKAQGLELAKASEVKFEAAIARQEKKVAEEATKAKSQFLANMSHEIRTPLNSIIGYSEMLEDNSLSEQEKSDAAETVNVCGKHLLSIINNVLDVSKIEANKIELEWLNTDLLAFAEEIKAIVEHAAQAKHIQMKLDFTLPLPKMFVTDPTRLKQTLVNLSNNAIKFTEVGSVTIAIQCDSTAKLISFEVIDTGIGMTEKQQQKLFSAFSQADQSTTRQHGGTGLGLFISKEFTELMGGSITVSSAEGEGSRFRVALPLKTENDAQWFTSQDELEAHKKQTQKQGLEIPQLSGSILCADDNPDNLRLAKYLIEKTGAELEMVSDGEQAFESAMLNDYDLILMDMQMPVMSGIEATELLKGASCPSPIVMLTANVDSQSRSEIDDSGADGYFAKPIDTTKFYEMLGSYLSHDQNAKAPVIDDLALDDLKQEFIENLISYIEGLNESIQNQDWAEIQSLCHQLKGNAGMYQLHALSDAAKATELLLKNQDTVNIEESVKALLEEITKVRQLNAKI